MSDAQRGCRRRFQAPVRPLRKAPAGFLLVAIALVFVLASAVSPAVAQSPQTIVFYEDGFPAADSPAPSRAQLAALLPNATLTDVAGLHDALATPQSRVLVLPFGSAFPESAWSDIHSYLLHGGNLLILGGRPFTRAAYRENGKWRLRDFSVRFIRPLRINDYQQVPGSAGMSFVPNRELNFELPWFQWQRGFSPILRLSESDLYDREGSAGSIDARLFAHAWGVKGDQRLTAPSMEIDHYRKRFENGRWIFVPVELPSNFFASAEAVKLLPMLAARAAEGAEEFYLRPKSPLYESGEPVTYDFAWTGDVSRSDVTVRIQEIDEAHHTTSSEIAWKDLQAFHTVAQHAGFIRLESSLVVAGTVRRRYSSGYWLRNRDVLNSGPLLTVNADYFESNHRPFPVVGTTYMSSEAQRQFFVQPNAWIWDHEMEEMAGAGIRMLRSGWWSGWDRLLDANGDVSEQTLRCLEAFLMSAHRHGLSVQFTFFAFIPEVLGGENPYLDPQAVEKQKRFVLSVVKRFRDVPFLAYDLLNEPSISRHTWTTRPNRDTFELKAWNNWLRDRYPQADALAEAWNLPSPPGNEIALPVEREFAPRGMYLGTNSLRVYDYYLFTQSEFTAWASGLRDAIRATGSRQLVTVGQDEGGATDRLNPAFYADAIDFTTTHSWWLNDQLLWDSLVAKQRGKAMLVQETGLQRELTLDERARKTAEQEAATFERKMAMSFVQGAGALQWLWHTNAFMTFDNEMPIGAVRVDGTEKPEATVIRNMAKFALAAPDRFVSPRTPDVAIVISQAFQYSVSNALALEAQQKSVRALCYYAHIPAYVIAENRIAELGAPKLVILPSPQALAQTTWDALLRHADQGGTLLISGPAERDEHWRRTSRVLSLLGKGQAEMMLQPFNFREAALHLPEGDIRLSFEQNKQSLLEYLSFAGNDSIQTIQHGRGKILVSAFPVELGDGHEGAAAVYRYAARQAGVAPPFSSTGSISPGVLVYVTELRDSMFYIMVSESAEDQKLALTDRTTDAKIALTLPAGHAALALVDKKTKAIVARYGF